jgi:hypothetical protein
LNICLGDDLLEQRLTLNQGQLSQIVAVEVKQVEGDQQPSIRGGNMGRGKCRACSLVLRALRAIFLGIHVLCSMLSNQLLRPRPLPVVHNSVDHDRSKNAGANEPKYPELL